MALQERVGTNTPNSYLYGLGSTSPLMQTTAASVTAWYHSDALGSVRVLSNTTGGVSNTSSYSAYGTPTFTSGSTPNTHGYAGEQIDPTGLSYNRARYYDAGIGRFTQRDTFAGRVRNPLSLNRYVYTQNMPTMATDPSGLYYCDQPERETRQGFWILGQGPEYKQLCNELRETLDHSGRLQGKGLSPNEENNDALGALIDLFSNSAPYNLLPGGSLWSRSFHRFSGGTNAQERLNFVLWYSASGTFSNLRLGWGEGGFSPEFQDNDTSKTSYNPEGLKILSGQVGHFLSGVGGAYFGFPPSNACFVGHEMHDHGDIGGSLSDQIDSCQRALFSKAGGDANAAISADLRGDIAERERICNEIINNGDHTPGTSLADLRLTIKAFEFAQLIQNGTIKELDEATYWLTVNLRAPNPQE